MKRKIDKRVGLMIDKPRYKKTFLCFLGLHKASPYVIERINEKDYLVCKNCGRRYRMIEI